MHALPAPVAALNNAKRPYLTDGGFETWLFFQQGFEAPEFAAITLMRNADARAAMRRYFDAFLAMAEQADTGFVLDTNSWRGCVSWAPALGLSEEALLDLTDEAIRFAAEIRDAWRGSIAPVVLNGVVGPSGDGYSAEAAPTAEQALALHRPQIERLARGGVDMISALTMTSSAEAIGVARAAGAVGLPVVISFTVETDGRLPSGERLEAAIEETDRASQSEGGAAPIYYMVNCAHPDHFGDEVSGGGEWRRRIGGLRANASRLSHAELDEAETLDDGDPQEFGALHEALVAKLPNIKVLGGCCGTDHRHVGCVSQRLHGPIAA